MKKDRLAAMMALFALCSYTVWGWIERLPYSVVLAQADNLQIVMEGGVHIGYSNDFHCSPRYSGKFVARVRLKNGRIVESSLGTLWVCDGPWPLTLTDYNHDGRPDFNIGVQQNAMSSFYLLFTIGRNGRVEPLKVHHHDGSVDTSVTATTTGNSTTFEITADGFIAHSGEWMTPYVWRGGMFEEGAGVRAAPSRK